MFKFLTLKRVKCDACGRKGNKSCTHCMCKVCCVRHQLKTEEAPCRVQDHTAGGPVPQTTVTASAQAQGHIQAPSQQHSTSILQSNAEQNDQGTGKMHAKDHQQQVNGNAPVLGRPMLSDNTSMQFPDQNLQVTGNPHFMYNAPTFGMGMPATLPVAGPAGVHFPVTYGQHNSQLNGSVFPAPPNLHIHTPDGMMHPAYLGMSYDQVTRNHGDVYIQGGQVPYFTHSQSSPWSGTGMIPAGQHRDAMQSHTRYTKPMHTMGPGPVHTSNQASATSRTHHHRPSQQLQAVQSHAGHVHQF